MPDQSRGHAVEDALDADRAVLGHSGIRFFVLAGTDVPAKARVPYVLLLSSGRLRHEHVSENRIMFDTFSLDDTDDVIYLPVEGYHRSILIRKSQLNYISIPKHKFGAGAIESAEEELDGA